MKVSKEQIDRLSEALTEIMEFVPATKDDLARWYDKAQIIREDPELLTGAPELVWHYLTDADIRIKDEEYAEMQNGRIKGLILYLERGVMPSDKDV